MAHLEMKVSVIEIQTSLLKKKTDNYLNILNRDISTYDADIPI